MGNTYNKLKEMIVTVANALGEEMLQEVAFVGGCTTGLLLTDEFTKEAVRYTDDVDLIINVVGYARWVSFRERLMARGFVEAMDEDVNCRMRLGELQVDFMPDGRKVLGFSNDWYADAFASAQVYELSEDVSIKLLTPVFFVATKLEAYLGRGNNEPMGSRDIEDILNLFDGREELVKEIASANNDVRHYIADQIEKLLASDYFSYAVQSTSRSDTDREALIFERLEAVKDLG